MMRRICCNWKQRMKNAHWNGTMHQRDHHKSQLKDGTENTFRENLSSNKELE